MDDSYTTLNEKKQNVEEYILYDAIYIKFLNRQYITVTKYNILFKNTSVCSKSTPKCMALINIITFRTVIYSRWGGKRS